jgi:hypothetical protein
MCDFSHKKIEFIACARESRKYVELSSLINNDTDKDLGSLTLIKAMIVLIYKRANNIRLQNRKTTVCYGIYKLGYCNGRHSMRR